MNNFRFGIRQKIITGYIVIIICLMAAIFAVTHQLNSMKSERNFIIQHDIAVRDLTSQIEKDLLKMETNKRGYLITGDESYLQLYNEARSQWTNDFSELNDLLSDNSNQQKEIAAINENIKEWIAVAGNPPIKMKQQNDTEGISEFFKQDPGKEKTEEVLQQFDSFRNKEKALTEQRADSLNNQNRYLEFGLYGLLAFVIITSIVLAWVISGSIIKTISEVVATIRAMTTGGNLSSRIRVKSNDEIRDLGDATNELLNSFEERDWLQRSVTEVVSKNQGISSLESLAEIFLSATAQITESSYGAFYIKEGKKENIRFVKKGAFADSAAGDVGRNSFKLGQGLIGQCALEKRVQVINRIDADYTLISSGLGETKPTSILIAPIVHEDEIVAVIELASLKEYREQHIAFIEKVLETFGLTINRVIDRMEIARLLTESQAMTEELQAQSEELQTQSEELQMQSEELQMINEQLESRSQDAEEKSKALEIAKKELEEKAVQLESGSKYKSEFLANMSHELRTPLNSILILSEMLAENSSKSLSEEELEFAKVIHSSGQDLLNLINDILDLSKVEAGKLEIMLSEVNLSEFPSNLERNFTHIADQKGLNFTINVAPNVPTLLQTDEKRFQQIVKNLLSNAFKFTEKGSVSVSVKKVQTDVIYKGVDYWLEVAIKDTGIGIPKEKHELIFQAFQQGDGATIRKYGGTGLGLSISSEFAKLLGGRLQLQSEEGKGSTFKLLIPSISDETVSVQTFLGASAEVATALEQSGEVSVVAETPITAKMVTAEPEAEKPSISTDEENVFYGKTVLITDDDNRNIFALKTALEQKGMNILIANNGMECLDVLDSNKKIDLILMDIMMPEMDGYETMQRIRGNGGYSDLPIIALTAKAMKNDREKCLEAGASDYISKPLKLEQLFSVMHVWMTK
ncbi:hybrid sensor histidine kinase/response regulator [Fictibacillus phosphorivorans]|uniref:Circadian input-output histidine kinase CikA n=1 Tax=Fictibacillus phosphorivorans TaxID=1221500 RepID=A0A165N0D7_9BACL|nr:CHASE3 domain-containing protein [Fictibacillus phosphorivorans]KZE64134.1 hybrid sensor histidine kinase/response regulator [Fictibacillus phosphorivorans]